MRECMNSYQFTVDSLVASWARAGTSDMVTSSTVLASARRLAVHSVAVGKDTSAALLVTVGCGIQRYKECGIC